MRTAGIKEPGKRSGNRGTGKKRSGLSGPTSISHAATTVQRKPNCACGGSCPRCDGAPPVQPKLAISKPDDPLEREADRIAAQIMRMPEPATLPGNDAPTRTEKMQRKPEEPAKPSPNPRPASVNQLVPSTGLPLPGATRAFFESRFGTDFSAVRLHDGKKAHQAANQLHARAFSVGSDIVFREGELQPDTPSGRELLAHELTHVVQQGGAPISRQTLIGHATAPIIQRQFSLGGLFGNLVGSLSDKFDFSLGDLIPDFDFSSPEIPKPGFNPLDMVKRLIEGLKDNQIPTNFDEEQLVKLIELLGFNPRLMDQLRPLLTKRIIIFLLQTARERFLNWLAGLIDEAWPVGVGHELIGAIGITPLVPVDIDGKSKVDVFRMEQHLWQLTRIWRASLALAPSIEAGAGYTLGQVQVGLSAGAEAQAGVQGQLEEVFLLPFDEDEVFRPFFFGLISLGGAVLQAPLITLLTKLIFDINLREYLQKVRLEGGGFIAGAASALLGAAKTKKGSPGTEVHWLQKVIPGFSASAGFRVEAMTGMELQLTEDPERVKLKLFLGGGGRIKAMLGASLFELLKKRFNLIDIDVAGEIGIEGFLEKSGAVDWTGISVKLQSHPEDPFTGVKGSGTEIELHFGIPEPGEEGADGEDGALTGENLRAVIKQFLPESLSITKRIGMSAPFGRKALARYSNDFLNTALFGEKGKTLGLAFEGLLIVKLTLDREKIEAVVDWVSDLIQGTGTARLELEQLALEILNFFMTGSLPAGINAESIDNLLNKIGLEKAELRLSALLSASAFIKAAAEAKVRISGGLMGVRYRVIPLPFSTILDLIADFPKLFFGDQENPEDMRTGEQPSQQNKPKRRSVARIISETLIRSILPIPFPIDTIQDLLIQDDTGPEHPNCQNGVWQFDYDGCSVPGFVRFIAGIKDKNNPTGEAGLEFALGVASTRACDRHDECYQTCGADKKECDQDMLTDMLATCDKARDQKTEGKCRRWAFSYYTGVKLFGGGAFKERQEQVCACETDSHKP